MKNNFSGQRHKLRPKTYFYKKRIFWFLFLGVILAGFIIYATIFWQKLFIKNITVVGNIDIPAEKIIKVVAGNAEHNFLFFSSKSIFLFSSKKTQKKILESFPKIDSVAIQKKFSDNIIVNLAERKPVAILCGYKAVNENQCYFVDHNGVIYEETNKGTIGFSIMRQFNQTEFKLGFPVIDKKFIEYLILFQKKIKDINIKIIEITSKDEMQITTGEGWRVFFDPSSDVNLQITKLKLLLEANFPTENSRKNLQYIDLSSGDKAYYK